MTAISLLELQKIIKRSIDALPDTYWIVGEINELNVSIAGHCFLELVQRNDAKEQLEAKANATIWASTYRSLSPYFTNAAGSPLAEGMKILVRVAVQYNVLYGLQLNIIDIDPAYTVGEVELQRNKTLARLRADGVMDMNKALPMPLLPQRVAIVSSEQAAGYGDFMQQLHKNPYGYCFFTTLFAANVQGKNAEQTMIEALDSIYARSQDFDIVAILRGGGAQSDLICFDSYDLAYRIAQFPLPVITGIGHDKDVSVADCVAHTMLKTPTAAAEFLIEQFAVQEQYVAHLREQIFTIWDRKLVQSKTALQQYILHINLRVSNVWNTERAKITTHFPQRLRIAVSQTLQRERSRIQQWQTTVHLLDPQTVLQRGYSITLHNGKPLQSVQQVQQGDELQTLLKDGTIISNVIHN
ncbi:exodeoxyribonuclease 7 large subunit [Bacteroidia bacterium]|nr:exodeoxyribonuclease 7 large subunit [Bacteroidia bacterium]